MTDLFTQLGYDHLHSQRTLLNSVLELIALATLFQKN